MTAPAESTIAQKTSPGPLATALMDRGHLLAWMADADLGEKSIKWSKAQEERPEFCISKDLETKIWYHHASQAGVKTYSSATQCNSREDAEAIGIQRANDLSKDATLSAYIKNTIKTDDGRKIFTTKSAGEIEFPARNVVSYSHRGCRSCGTSGSVYCSGCNGNKTEPCPNRFCNHNGRVTCGGCGGTRGSRMSDGSWLSCSNCYGSGETLCVVCGGNTWIYCRDCRGSGRETCDPCAGHGYFTDRYEIYGETSIKTRSAGTSGASIHTGRIESWALTDFTGANSGGGCPTLGSPIVKSGGFKDKKHTFTIDFKGNVSVATAAGDLSGATVTGTALQLDKKYFRFNPFVSGKITEKIDAVLADAVGPKSIAEGVSKSPTLKELVKQLTKTSATARTSERPSGEIDKIISSITSQLDGSIESKSLAPLATAFSASKQEFSGRIWRKAWMPFLIKLLPLTFLYVFLNLPYRIKEALGAKDLGDDATFWSFLLLAVIVAIPTGMAVRDVIVNLKKELGHDAKLSAPFHNGYFAAAGIVAMLLAAYGSASTYVQGPKLDGMYLSQFGLWRTPTANAAPQKRAEEPDASPANADPAAAHLNGKSPASSRTGVPKQAASQKAANPTGSNP